MYLVQNLNMLIMGGDARYLEVIKTLAGEGVNIFAAGFDKCKFNSASINHADVDNMDLSTIDAITLPVAGTDPSGEVEVEYADKPLFISEKTLKKTPAHCIIYTGTSNDFLENIAVSANRKLVELFARDDMAVYNSIPTAEGALRLAMEETNVTIHSANVMVLGFGRVGITVARLFAAVGANVQAAARKPSALARVKEMGLTPVKISEIKEHADKATIFVNTVPHPILDAEVISAMDPEALILDLASKPGGTDFNFAKEKGIKALHALGLPGKNAPKTAGEIIGGVLLELLKENLSN